MSYLISFVSFVSIVASVVSFRERHRRVPRGSCSVALTLLLVTGLAGSAALQGQVADQWDDSRLIRWFSAVERHGPGAIDGSLIDMAGLSATDLEGLWADIQILLLIVEDPNRTRFSVPALDLDPHPSSRRPQRSITIRRDQRTRLDRMAERVRVMSVNRLLQRAAILHTDVAILAPNVAAASAGPTSAAAPLFMKIGDGVDLGAERVTLHWELARRVMGTVRPDPAADPFVRDWYRATLGVMQHAERFDTPHLQAALRAVPGDPEILFLAGCEHEAFATPLFQAFARSFRDSLLRPGINSPGRELADAERYFRRALGADGDHREARLRLGRVLTLRGRYPEAVTELRRVAASDVEPLLAYFAALFLGDAYQRLGDLHQARDWFERAAASMPDARAPQLSLARVARELGDRETSGASLARALTEAPASGADDPWWHYRAAQGRHGLVRLDALRASLPRDQP